MYVHRRDLGFLMVSWALLICKQVLHRQGFFQLLFFNCSTALRTLQSLRAEACCQSGIRNGRNWLSPRTSYTPARPRTATGRPANDNEDHAGAPVVRRRPWVGLLRQPSAGHPAVAGGGTGHTTTTSSSRPSAEGRSSLHPAQEEQGGAPRIDRVVGCVFRSGLICFLRERVSYSRVVLGWSRP